MSFGVGKDFWTNVILTLCGLVPGKLIFVCRIELAVSETEARSGPQFLRTGAIYSSILERGPILTGGLPY